MQFYFKAQSQHGHSMLQLAVELARIRSFFGDAPYIPSLVGGPCMLPRSRARNGSLRSFSSGLENRAA